MNTSKLQAFATDARRQLMNAVQARLDAALVPNSDAQVDDPRAFAFLKREIEQAGGSEQGRKHVVERYAYRWFNRIIAFRYMDVHGFTGTPVVSPAGLTSTNGLPEVLAAAKRGEYDDSTVFSLRVNGKAKERIEGLLSGSILADDPQGLAYGLLLQSECRFWNRNLPFMFENVGKEAGRVDELLMPADLLAEGSVLRNAVEAMTPEDCGVDDPSGNVEIIGWLYQYYISERKNEVMDGFKKNHKAGAEEIPAATQLFTPDWIVRYLVQNTVGRLWMQSHPDSQLYKNWDYYIQPSKDDSAGNEDILNIQAPEDLTVCDPACGSGHMLTYAFDLLYEIYEEEGYAPSDIPGLILKHNLYGMEIDERAASLAAFALTMKARSRSRRFFKKQVEPNIQHISPIAFKEDEVVELNDLYQVNLDSMVWNTYAKADVYGSLIQPPQELVELAASSPESEDGIDTLFDPLLREHAEDVFTQTRYLARKYAAVVANPPYMGAKNMSAELKQFVQDHYEDGKADLFAAFILRNRQFIQHGAMLGMITMQSWMFLSSFEALRRKLLDSSSIETMAHLGAGAFDSIGGEVVSTTAFTLKNGFSSGNGTYIRLVNVSGDDNQSNACINAIKGDVDYRFEVGQHEFAQIPGSPIVYWLSKSMLDTFAKNKALEEIAEPKVGLQTGDNARFVREWWEPSNYKTGFDCESREESIEREAKWFPYNKGGEYRKWYGNQEFVVNWENDGQEIRSFGTEDGGRPRSRPQNTITYFQPSISWSKISSGAPAFRYFPQGFIYDVAGTSIFCTNEQRKGIIAYTNSSLAYAQLTAIAPTLNFEVGQIASLPIVNDDSKDAERNVDDLIAVSKADWDSFESSWNYHQFALLDSKQGAQCNDLLEDAVLHLREYWNRVSEEQRQREICNNELVADAYGVRDEVPCDVPLERVSLKRNVAFAYPKDTPEVRNEKFAQDVVKELISYAVGCMFGRYSLDKPGLILASQGETLNDFHAQIPNPSFEPDADNVIPVTETDCFEDDIVTRFRRFLTVAFGKENLAANIAYIEQVLGKSIRKYFVNDFYNDHVKMYSNRPIYWQYSSQTNNKGSFKALVYLHRYTPKTTNVVLNYLRDYANKIADIADSLERSDRTTDKKQAAKLRKAILECKDYEDQTLYPLATSNLEIDLDDGVLVNYLRMGKALRSIPAIEKKRKEVSTWTWPVHPLKEEDKEVRNGKE